MAEELLARRQKALSASEEKVKARHERGLLTARERVAALLDPGSFFEVGLLSHSDVPGAEAQSRLTLVYLESNVLRSNAV